MVINWEHMAELQFFNVPSFKCSTAQQCNAYQKINNPAIKATMLALLVK
jgi:hypothetical protein